MKNHFKRRRPKKPPWRQRLLSRLLAAPPRLQHLLAGGEVELDGQRLDSGLALLCRLAGGKSCFSGLEPDAARHRMSALRAKLPTAGALMDRVEDLRFPGPGGELVARLYTPPDLRPEPPGLLYLHGGGWVLGDLDSHDAWCRLIAGQTPCKVLSLDYRLAPEHPFPAGLDDALAAFRFMRENAARLGLDPRRLAIGGDSAGGNLATVVCQESREEQRPCGQLLIYPVTGGERGSHLETPSYRLFAEGFGLTRASMEWFYGHYLEDPALVEDPRVSPLLAEDLSGQPPAILATAGFDVLRDEGDAYAERLREAEVELVHLRFPSLTHSFANISGYAPCRRALDEIISQLAALFHRLAE